MPPIVEETMRPNIVGLIPNFANRIAAIVLAKMSAIPLPIPVRQTSLNVLTRNQIKQQLSDADSHMNGITSMLIQIFLWRRKYIIVGSYSSGCNSSFPSFVVKSISDRLGVPTFAQADVSSEVFFMQSRGLKSSLTFCQVAIVFKCLCVSLSLCWSISHLGDSGRKKHAKKDQI